jgi:hypothetical protein
MIRISFFSAAVANLISFCLGSSAHAAGPEEQLIEAVKVALGKNFNTDWSGLGALPGIKRAPLPPASLQNCLPDAVIGLEIFFSTQRGRIVSPLENRAGRFQM